MARHPLKGKTRADFLREFELGERRYVDLNIEDYNREQKLYQTAASRIASFRFSTVLCTVVLSNPHGATRHLICLERIE